MKQLTPAAITLLKSLAAGRGNYATHPSTRSALSERGWMTQEPRGPYGHKVYVITDTGMAAVKRLGDIEAIASTKLHREIHARAVAAGFSDKS